MRIRLTKEDESAGLDKYGLRNIHLDEEVEDLDEMLDLLEVFLYECGFDLPDNFRLVVDEGDYNDAA